MLMVGSWSYSFKNWAYVVLSRVKSLRGLFLCKPLDVNQTFEVDDDLERFERKMYFLEGSVMSRIDLSDAPEE